MTRGPRDSHPESIGARKAMARVFKYGKSANGNANGSRTLRHRTRISLVLCLYTLVSALGSATSVGAIPLISEVFYDAVGSDNGFSFVELYGTAGTSLDGMTLEGVNGANGAVGPIVTLSGVIPEDGIFLVADTNGGVTQVSGADQLANFDYQNGPDSILLMLGETVLDALGYGEFDPGEFFAGEGTPAADAPAGSSLARLIANVDLDDNALDFAVLPVPSPGSVEALSVPEPGSGLLAMVGLVGMAHRRRRCRARTRGAEGLIEVAKLE